MVSVAAILHINLIQMVRAGVTDSSLTNHGVLQIESLARHFASENIHFDRVFASDLTRTRLTAEGICRPDPQANQEPYLTPFLTSNLREKNFGSKEGQRIQTGSTTRESNINQASLGSNVSPNLVESESNLSMKERALSFLTRDLLPLIFEDTNEGSNIAIVSHGLFMRVLWNCLLEFFDPAQVVLKTDDMALNSLPMPEFTPGWSNTGFMQFTIRSGSDIKVNTIAGKSTGAYLLNGWSLEILAVDSKNHLNNLRRTRGGIGSATHDARQKRIDQFFKK